MTSIIVIGAGIVGASIAHHLSRAGHNVTVIEQGEAGGEVTASSFAWLGLAKSTAAAQQGKLRSQALQQFDRMLLELTEHSGATESHKTLNYRQHGAISWEENDAETRRFVAEHTAAGNVMRLLSSAETLALEPNLAAAPSAAAYASEDAGIDPVALSRALLSSAERHGATLRMHTRAAKILQEHGRVVGVRTDNGDVYGSSVVLAAGTASASLAASVGATVDLAPAPCCLIRFSTEAPLLRGILSTPELEVRQLNDTTLLAAEDVPPGFSGDPAELVPGALAAILATFKDAKGVQLEHASIADRPMPRDGEPLVGPATDTPGLYLAVAHPAVILAAAIGAQVTADYALPAEAHPIAT